MANNINISSAMVLYHDPLTYSQIFNIVSGTYTTGGITLNPQNIPNISNAYVAGVTGNINNIILTGSMGLNIKVSSVNATNNTVTIQIFYNTIDAKTNTITSNELANNTDISGLVLILAFTQ